MKRLKLKKEVKVLLRKVITTIILLIISGLVYKNIGSWSELAKTSLLFEGITLISGVWLFSQIFILSAIWE